MKRILFFLTVLAVAGLPSYANSDILSLSKMANDGNLYFTKSKSFGVALNIAEGVIFPVEKIEEARTYQATWDGLGLLPGFIIKNDANDEIKLVSHKEKGDEIILTFSVNEKSSIKIYRITKDRQMNYNFDLLEK